MKTKTLTMPEDALVSMLKSLSEESLINVFWKTLVESDIYPLTEEEIQETYKAKIELEKGETVGWEDIR
ncbi:MAG: hypothetical protein MRJ65_04220 [Candidatus Brocadiaceae bacterium]|nr:hypothetical protein [Candidatus Brocadiaceae bacterium]